MANQTPLAFLILLVCVVFSGCSDGGPPPLDVYPVTGTVRLDGKPAGGVSIAFVPDGGAGGGGVAVSDSAGQFSLKCKDGRDGVPAGKYYVLFVKMTMPDGSPIPEGEMAADVGAANSLPAIYNEPGSSLKAEVKAGENAPLEFDLKSKR